MKEKELETLDSINFKLIQERLRLQKRIQEIDYQFEINKQVREFTEVVGPGYFTSEKKEG